MFRKATHSLILVGLLFAIPNFGGAATIDNSNSAVETSTTVSTSVRWNNENWFTSPHPEPETFFVTPEREVFGTTTTGIPFSQINITNEHGVRVQKFILQDHYHYIVDSKIVYSEEDLEMAIAQEILEADLSLARVTDTLMNE